MSVQAAHTIWESNKNSKDREDVHFTLITEIETGIAEFREKHKLVVYHKADRSCVLNCWIAETETGLAEYKEKHSLVVDQEADKVKRS